MNDLRQPMLLVADKSELPVTERIWGTGGWLPPDQREALDWLTLAKVCGWGVTIVRKDENSLIGDLRGGSHWIVLACDPSSPLSESIIAWLTRRLAEEPVLVVVRAPATGAPLTRLTGASVTAHSFSGHCLKWFGPGGEHQWKCRKVFSAQALSITPDAARWVTLNDRPIVVARQAGRGLIVTLGFHPSEGRDTDGKVTALLMRLLVWGSSKPVAWFDFAGTMVLRMDDPGGAQNVHLKSWHHPKLGVSEWAEIAEELKRRDGRLSIAYVPGWVDDGDAERGRLTVRGHAATRIPGAVHPSPHVRYTEQAGGQQGFFQDYVSEYRGIQTLRAAGLGDVELHGFTHMHPDSSAWAKAADRYDTIAWFRELGRSAEAILGRRSTGTHPIMLGIEALRRFFGVLPTTLICPGDEWTNTTLEYALDAGLYFVGSYYLAIREDNRFCWCTHICAPYLDEAHAAWFDSGLPVVGYFHDREPALEGTRWIAHCLDEWETVGARRFIDFRQLAAAVRQQLHLSFSEGTLRLAVTNHGTPALVRGQPFNIYVPDMRLPSTLLVSQSGKESMLNVDVTSEGFGRGVLPGSPVRQGSRRFRGCS